MMESTLIKEIIITLLMNVITIYLIHFIKDLLLDNGVSNWSILIPITLICFFNWILATYNFDLFKFNLIAWAIIIAVFIVKCLIDFVKCIKYLSVKIHSKGNKISLCTFLDYYNYDFNLFTFFKYPMLFLTTYTYFKKLDTFLDNGLVINAYAYKCLNDIYNK